MRSYPAVLILMITLLFAACQNAQHASKLSKDIDADLQTIITDQSSSLSSNPYGYITNNQEAYNRIVRHGNAALDYLTKELKTSDRNGLKEWIMAKACADILQEKNPVTVWETGKEWLTQYEQSN